MIKNPVLIIGCPRAGTTLLYNMLSEVSSLWSIGYESKAIIERYHHPRQKGWESGALDAADLTPESRQFMLDAFKQQAAPGAFWRQLNWLRTGMRRNPLWRFIKQRGRTEKTGAAMSSALPQQGLDTVRRLVQLRNRLKLNTATPIRLLEKTPENCLRLPFLLALFPDAQVIYLTRRGPGNINSLMEGWRQPNLFSGYQVPDPITIPGDTRGRWAFTLIPGWRELTGRPLEEVCAWQWIRCNEAVLAHKANTVGRVPYLTVQYEALVKSPAEVLSDIADFIEVDFERELGRFARNLPQINVVSEPGKEKWRRQNEAVITNILPLIQPMMRQLDYDNNS